MAEFAHLRKKLYFQSAHRGTKENDLLLTRFAADNLPLMTGAELEVFGRFLQEPDQYIYSWIVTNENVPPEYRDFIDKIRKDRA